MPDKHGLVWLDKACGPTSHDVVAKVRRLAGQKRVGHVGTLDPMATGLLGVLLGSATALAPWLSGLGKNYRGRLELGLRTDTDDVTGRALRRHEGPWPDLEAVRSALAALEGTHEQRPPDYSAVKVGGQSAHKAARAGRPLELAPRLATARRLALLNYQPPHLEFLAEVSSGYYIRSLARDLGEALGLGGAALSALRRETVGPWTLETAVTLEELADAGEAAWAARLIGPAEALPFLAGLELEAGFARRFGHGQRLVPGRDFADPGPAPGPYKVLSPEGQLLGLAEIIRPDNAVGVDGRPRGPFLRPLRVFTGGSEPPPPKP